MTTARETVCHPLIRHLLALAGEPDRAALAALRRGLGKPPGTAPETWPHVEPFIGQRRSGRYEDACYTVAALFASHWQAQWDGPHHHVHSNLGASFRLLAKRRTTESGEGADKSIERRFLALLSCRESELHQHLRHAVSLLKAGDVPVPVDWGQLLKDIPWWHHPERYAQRRWARAYWGFPGQGEAGGAEERAQEPEAGDDSVDDDDA